MFFPSARDGRNGSIDGMQTGPIQVPAPSGGLVIAGATGALGNEVLKNLALLGSSLMFLAIPANFLASVIYLFRRNAALDAFAVSTAEVGVVFCTIVLLTGPIWGKPAWGIWWTWDARLTSTLVLWVAPTRSGGWLRCTPAVRLFCKEELAIRFRPPSAHPVAQQSVRDAGQRREMPQR